MSEKQVAVIVDPQGKPARETPKCCPTCGKGPEFRRPQSTFGGDEKFHCVKCGGDW